MKRPFQVLGVQQIAIGGPDKKRLQKLWVDIGTGSDWHFSERKGEC